MYFARVCYMRGTYSRNCEMLGQHALLLAHLAKSVRLFVATSSPHGGGIALILVAL